MDRTNIFSTYVEICNGFTYDKKNNIFWKHLLPEDIYICEYKRDEAITSAIEKGALSEDELLDIHKKNGSWSDAEERSIKSIESDFHRLNEARTRPISQEQLKALRVELKDIEQQWFKLIVKKKTLTGTSASSIGENIFTENKIILSAYKDKNLTIQAFSEESLSALSDFEYYNLVSSYEEVEKKLSIDNIAWVCYSDLVQKKISLSSKPFDFFGKPVVQLTDYQIYLLKLGEKYKTLLSVDGAPEDYQNPVGIEDWFYLKQANALPTEEEKNKAQSMWN